MRKRIANRLIRIARRLDPNSCVDFTPIPTRSAVININNLRPTATHEAMHRLQQQYLDALKAAGHVTRAR